MNNNSFNYCNILKLRLRKNIFYIINSFKKVKIHLVEGQNCPQLGLSWPKFHP